MGKGSSEIFIKCMYVCCNREHSCLICMGLQPRSPIGTGLYHSATRTWISLVSYSYQFKREPASVGMRDIFTLLVCFN